MDFTSFVEDLESQFTTVRLQHGGGELVVPDIPVDLGLLAEDHFPPDVVDASSAYKVLGDAAGMAALITYEWDEEGSPNWHSTLDVLMLHVSPNDGVLPAEAVAFLTTCRGEKLALEEEEGLALDLVTAWGPLPVDLSWPDQLAYFNELAGGPSRGHRYLDDSNIDWGQDLKRLKRYVGREGIERIKLRLGPHASPDHYGIRW